MLNVIDECLAYGLPKPTYEYDWGAVKVTFYKAKDNEGISEGISEGINSLYSYIKENPALRVSELSKRLNTPAKTLERWIKRLKDEDKIEYNGSKRTGGYCVK
jgi:ATP-dependent DNA helicase RecG